MSLRQIVYGNRVSFSPVSSVPAASSFTYCLFFKVDTLPAIATDQAYIVYNQTLTGTNGSGVGNQVIVSGLGDVWLQTEWGSKLSPIVGRITAGGSALANWYFLAWRGNGSGTTAQNVSLMPVGATTLATASVGFAAGTEVNTLILGTAFADGEFGTRTMNGYIAHFRIFNRPLSDAELLVEAARPDPIASGATSYFAFLNSLSATSGSGTFNAMEVAPGYSADVPRVLASPGLVARYYLNEAESGTSVTSVLDSSPNAYHLNDVAYNGGTMQWVKLFGQRGLYSNTYSVPAYAKRRATTNDALLQKSGGTKWTIEIVSDRLLGTNNNERIFALHTILNTSISGLAVNINPTELTVGFQEVFVGSLLNIYTPASGIRTLHAVIDTTQATEANRVRIYVNGVFASQMVLGTAPVQNSGLTLTTDFETLIFNRSTYLRSPVGTLFYAALYADALSATDVANNHSVLIVDSDAIPAPTPPVTVEGPLAQNGFVQVDAFQIDAFIYLRPSADVTTQWSTSSGTSHFALIDEEVADDSDYVFATSVGSTDEVQVPALIGPQDNIVIKYRVQGILDGGAVTVSMRQGATLIKADTTRTANGTYTLTVTPAEYAGVTNWSDIRLRFVSA